MENIKYQIIRSRRKTLSLTVSQEGKIILRAPYGVSGAYLDDFVEKHRDWLSGRLLQVACKPKLDLSDGAIIVLFGSRYLIQSGRTRIDRGLIYLPLEGRERALIGFLKKFSLEAMGMLTERIARRYGFKYARVRISSARGRWGSCNSEGVIAYTFRVAFLPPALCEYVAVHELAHTLQFDHSPTFWQIVEKILPDWKIRRKELKTSTAMGYL